MTLRGRPSLGVGHVDRLEGDLLTKERLQTILRVLGGELRVTDACATLGVSEAQFHRLRERALQGALTALEPRPPGRPRSELVEEVSRVAALQAQLDDLAMELRAAQLREEIALVMPHLLQPRGEKKTGTARRKRRRPRRR